MPEFVFRRSFPWVQKALTPVIPILGPDTFLSTLIPTVDIFGTQRIDEQKFELVLGGVGNVEVFHEAVPPDRIRLYSATELTHDDTVNHWIRIGQIISPGPGSFSFVGLSSAALRPGATSPEAGEGAIATRAIWVGPGNRVSGRAEAMGGGAQLALRLVWVELVLGESIRFS